MIKQDVSFFTKVQTTKFKTASSNSHLTHKEFDSRVYQKEGQLQLIVLALNKRNIKRGEMQETIITKYQSKNAKVKKLINDILLYFHREYKKWMNLQRKNNNNSISLKKTKTFFRSEREKSSHTANSKIK